MSDVQIRIAEPSELEQFAALREQGYGLPAGRRAAWAQQMLSTGRAERLLGAFRSGRLVGMLNVLAFEQYFGGRAVPMGGVASVVVAPEERGFGIAPRMLAGALDLMRERGEVISTLGPATSWVYRKCGWEHAGLYGVASVRTADLVGLAEGPSRERRATPADRGGIVTAYERVAPAHPGFLARPPWLWDERLEETPGRYTYVVDHGGAIAGFVTYKETVAARGYTVWVEDFAAVDAAAERTLWRHLGAHAAQADRVTIAGVPLDVLAHLLPEQTIRPVGQQIWMTRVVDVAAAIERRGYAPAVRADVELRLVDPTRATNDGCWRLTVEDGAGRLEPLDVQRAPDAVITVNGLGALYTGWSSTAVLLESGLAQGIAADTAATLDAVFGGRRPAMCDEF